MDYRKKLSDYISREIPRADESAEAAYIAESTGKSSSEVELFCKKKAEWYAMKQFEALRQSFCPDDVVGFIEKETDICRKDILTMNYYARKYRAENDLSDRYFIDIYPDLETYLEASFYKAVRIG